MIYEYALEPALLNNWQNFRYFTENFGVPKGRLISRYPKHWKRMVYESLSGCGEIDRKRIEEGLQRLDKRMIKRQGEWAQQRDWLTNAEAEHAKRPFQAVVAGSNPRNREFVLEADGLSETNALWGLPTLPPVHRVATEMAQRVAPLLCFATRILLIDPHFSPDKIRWRRPLQAFLAVAINSRRAGETVKVEIHVNDDVESTFFERQCRQCLPEIIPAGISVRVVQWREKQQGDRLHNRFILTDIGGVSFGVGLDDADGDDGQTDDIQVLNEETYQFRIAQYAGSTPAFELVGELTVVGKR